ncbi:pH-response regulator protein palA/rim20 [Tulasnella sp. JGI-2019a]|nr:pH-response regulator protein palA/rim20 [Tulasnella sp. JGI-2019a]KAG9033360.1 pH-response regulator protein palA/rim20 [Tulasnella sp. JGI-2019a]
MSNQLLVPFKRSRPNDIKTAVRQYIEINHPETHPDAFRQDVERWDALRKDAIAEGTHISKIQVLFKYQAQLVFILTKLPPEINLEFTYDPVFRTSNTTTLSFANICFERVCVLYNLASLYCKLATDQDKESSEGIKHATNYFQSAAGTLSFLIDSALPAFQATHGRPLPVDLTEPFFLALQYLMMAQAQECAWQKARLSGATNNIVSKLAMGVSLHYKKSLDILNNNSNHVAGAFLPEWRTHIEIKTLHFEAVAQFRKARDDNTGGRYGVEVARLDVAKTCSQKCNELCRRNRNSIASLVQSNASDLLKSVEGNWTTANKDNDLIYHQDVPSESHVPVIKEADIVKAAIAPELVHPDSLVRSDSEPPIFGDLVAHGVRMAVELYQDRRSNWIKDEIFDLQKTLDSRITITLQELYLPAAIDALDKRVGLPPSLLAKAEEVRRDGGVSRIATLMRDRQRVSEQASRVLQQAFDILDQEAEDDAEYRDAYEKHDVWDRTPSHEANGDLIAAITKYEEALRTAAASDATVNDKWLQWENLVEVLGRNNDEIEAYVPSVRMSDQARDVVIGSTTQHQARVLRDLLEQLQSTEVERAETVDRVKRVAAADDIQPQISRQAQAFERWVEVKPAMFEDVLSNELAKYDQYREEVEASRLKQELLLGKLKVANDAFLRSRQDDPVVKERQRALQTLALAYDGYSETVSNLSEGLMFYNKLAVVATELRDSCQNWADQRNKEVEWLTEALISMQPGPGQPVDSAPSTLRSPGAHRQTFAPSPAEEAPFDDAVLVSAPATQQNPSAQESIIHQPQAASVATDFARPTFTQQPQSTQQSTVFTVEQSPVIGIPNAPSKAPQYARDVSDADDREAVPTPTPKQPQLVRGLMNDDDWEDNTVMSPAGLLAQVRVPPPTPKAKTKATPAVSQDSPKTRSSNRKTRLPA